MKKVFKSLTGLAFAIVMVLSVSCQNDPESLTQNLSAPVRFQLNTIYTCKGASSTEKFSIKSESLKPESLKPELLKSESLFLSYSYFYKDKDTDKEIESKNLEGTVVDIFNPNGYSGVILIVQSSYHKNWQPSCYPDYDETSEHRDCYSAIYIESGEGESCNMATTIFPVDSHSITTCASSLVKLLELFANCGLTPSCEPVFGSTTLSRSLVLGIPRFIQHGAFTAN